MSGSVGIAGDQLRTIVERIETVEEEIKELYLAVTLRPPPVSHGSLEARWPRAGQPLAATRLVEVRASCLP
jgi:hypothetical protein